MKTVVGRPDRPTPVMHDQVRYVELFPYWNVPQKLARRDILPKVLADPAVPAGPRFSRVRELETRGRGNRRGHHRLGRSQSWDIAFRFRQDPGPRNPLGRMKFLFPNSFSIYLHDTNQRDIFTRDPARYLRAVSGWKTRKAWPACWLPKRISPTCWNPRKTGPIWPKKVPIFIVYQTVWIDDSGR